ncbi:MAG TPA: hypothetical protein VG889_08305 [Rhizomicrobium sp.]|nr:hypothetical protein [Rhizomicrobium sp.]
MLRSALIAVGALCVVCGLAGLATGTLAAGWAVFWGAILLLGTVLERVRYKQLENGRPGPGWIATSERFIDDETGKPVRVWLEPATGERRYVTE